MVGGIAKSFLKADDVEDVIQEVFMRVYKSIRKFKGDSAFSTWLYRITVNICKDILKKYSRRSETFTDFDDDEPGGIREPSSGIDIEEQIGKEMKIQDFKNILNQLSEEDNLFITLRDIDGLGYEEIGNVVGKPIGTVKSRIYYARKRLKKLLQQNDIGD
jgi:RNA polymerase sigma-70 factor (ECF subfamily)